MVQALLSLQVPVVGVCTQPITRSQLSAVQALPSSQLVAQSPDGVTLKLDGNERELALMSTMIETLVRCHVPARP